MRLKTIILFAALLMVAASAQARKHKPATVIITAGQSNTDGRVMNADLPDYIKKNRYKHCYWCYGTSGKIQTDSTLFELFWPRLGMKNHPDRWGYDAVTYYRLDKKAKRDFYVIKWSIGGTAIDPSCERSTSKKYWSADSAWIARHSSTLRKGRSLLKSFTEEISLCIDSSLSKLNDGYDIKAMLWHQGESDFAAGENYYKNLKNVVAYVRHFLAEKTGEERYLRLPFICGTVARSNKYFNKDVENAMFLLESEDPNFYVIDMADGELQADRLHFTAKSAEYLGNKMYEKLVEIGAVDD